MKPHYRLHYFAGHWHVSGEYRHPNGEIITSWVAYWRKYAGEAIDEISGSEEPLPRTELEETV